MDRGKKGWRKSRNIDNSIRSNSKSKEEAVKERYLPNIN
jgi:ribosomal protein L32E